MAMALWNTNPLWFLLGGFIISIVGVLINYIENKHKDVDITIDFDCQNPSDKRFPYNHRVLPV